MLDKDSIFFNIPRNLDKKQAFLLEGIRICFNSIFVSHFTLRDELEYISVNPKRKHSHTLIFKEAWQQIDITHRLCNLILSFGIYNEEDIIYLKEVKPFRNTFQHIDERIDEFISELNAPLWGNISWLRINDGKNVNSINSYVLTAGHPGKDFKTTIINPAGKTFKGTLDFITLESVKKNENEKIVAIDLSNLYRRTESLIEKLELEVKNQIDELRKDILQEEILAQDIFACVKLTSQ